MKYGMDSGKKTKNTHAYLGLLGVVEVCSLLSSILVCNVNDQGEALIAALTESLIHITLM